MKHSVVIALASNCSQEQYLREAQQRLTQILSVSRFTPSLWTAPVNSTRPDQYLNMLAYAETHLSLDDLNATLKHIESEMGRTQKERQQGIVRIDLDIMRYDDQRYHLKDWERDYIKKLL